MTSSKISYFGCTASKFKFSGHKVFDGVSFHHGPVLQGEDRKMAFLVGWVIWSYLSIKVTEEINTVLGGVYQLSIAEIIVHSKQSHASKACNNQLIHLVVS